jgi:hypothetical protein
VATHGSGPHAAIRTLTDSDPFSGAGKSGDEQLAGRFRGEPGELAQHADGRRSRPRNRAAHRHLTEPG